MVDQSVMEILLKPDLVPNQDVQLIVNGVSTVDGLNVMLLVAEEYKEGDGL